MEFFTSSSSSSSSSSDDDESGSKVNNHQSYVLPPLEKGNLMDWSAWVVECPKCPGKRIPFNLLERHKAWHGRVNLLFHLRAAVVENHLATATPSFGPSESGCFLRINYKCKDKLVGTDVNHDVFLALFSAMGQQRFVNLEYIDGLKYTFGNKFISRQSQGEFIYLNLNPDDGKEENYFTLKCTDDCIWISPCEGEGFYPSTIVSINGTPLRVNTSNGGGNTEYSQVPSSSSSMLKLVFGDIVTVTTPSGDDNGGEEKEQSFCDFVFMASKHTNHSRRKRCPESNVVEAIPIAMEATNEGALHNPLIVQNILRFLPTDVLKVVRFGSHFWNMEALKALRNRVVVTILKLGFNKDTDLSVSLMQVSDYAYSSLNGLKFPHWNIELPEHIAEVVLMKRKQQSDCLQREMMRDLKILDDLKWLLGPEFQPHNVKSLQLSGRVKSETSLNILEVLLCGVKNTLTRLSLRVHFFPTLNPCLPSLDELKSLKTLCLLFGGPPGEPPSSFKPFLEGFLPGVHNIKTLSLANSYISGPTAAERYSTVVLDEIAKIQARGKFPNLAEITLENCVQSQVMPLAALQPGSLRKLVLGNLHLSVTTALLPALEKNAGTLEELTLQLPVTSMDRWNVINFPQRMHKLKSLSLLFFSHFPLEGPPTLRFKFGAGAAVVADGIDDARITHVDYMRHFPSLSKLTVWPGSSKFSVIDDPEKRVVRTRGNWDFFGPIAAAFIQPVTNENGYTITAPSVQNVVIPLLIKGKYHRVLDNLETMFPNASFPQELASARDEPVWSPDNEEEDEEEDSSTEEEDEDEGE